MPQPAIVIERLALGYANRTVIENFSTTIATGAFLGIFGPNGAGKTTFLQCLLGLIQPLHGKITVLQETPHTGCRRVGYVPQGLPQLNIPISGRALLQAAISGTRLGLPLLSKAARQQVEDAITLMNAQDYAYRPFMQLSGGEKRRLLVAQALLGKPELLLLDEPLANVDPNYQYVLVDLLDHVRKTLNITVLLTAHDINPLAKVMTDVLYLAKGKAVVGTVSEVIRSDILTQLYGAPVEVIRHEDRLFIMHSATGRTDNFVCHH
ncbi:MAG: putative transporter ATP-binding protein [Gammaproteobacteria bacterium]|jgi:zinc/manganese transport system ATP-binding protein|nr:putative transporter ATP-binding protein [Gammaproteobacteria bacterium]